MTLPQCFGLYWEAIASNPDCNEKCGAKDECLARFATETLVKYQRELGAAATPHALAELTGVNPAAILLAIDYQGKVGLQKAVQPAQQTLPLPPPPSMEPPTPPPPPPAVPPPALPTPPPLALQPDLPTPPPAVGAPTQPAAPQPPVPPMPVAAIEEPQEDLQEESPEEPVEVKPAKRPPRKKAAPKAGAAEEKNPPATKPAKAETKGTKKAPPAATKKAPPKKKTAPKKKEPPANFPKAGAALRAAAPAERPTGTSVAPARGPDNGRTWSQEHDLARFRRERARSPLIRKLRPGKCLERRWPWNDGKGPKHRVVVHKDHYRYRGRRFPTLYSVVKAITGTKPHAKQRRQDGSLPDGSRQLTTWSAAKFFGLAKEMLTLEEERAGMGREKRLPKKKKRSRRPK